MSVLSQRFVKQVSVRGRTRLQGESGDTPDSVTDAPSCAVTDWVVISPATATNTLSITKVSCPDGYGYFEPFFGLTVRLSTVYSMNGANISSQLCSAQNTSLFGAGLYRFLRELS
jgi:hypothetical protein